MLFEMLTGSGAVLPQGHRQDARGCICSRRGRRSPSRKPELARLVRIGELVEALLADRSRAASERRRRGAPIAAGRLGAGSRCGGRGGGAARDAGDRQRRHARGHGHRPRRTVAGAGAVAVGTGPGRHRPQSRQSPAIRRARRTQPSTRRGVAAIDARGAGALRWGRRSSPARSRSALRSGCAPPEAAGGERARRRLRGARRPAAIPAGGRRTAGAAGPTCAHVGPADIEPATPPHTREAPSPAVIPIAADQAPQDAKAEAVVDRSKTRKRRATEPADETSGATLTSPTVPLATDPPGASGAPSQPEPSAPLSKAPRDLKDPFPGK